MGQTYASRTFYPCPPCCTTAAAALVTTTPAVANRRGRFAVATPRLTRDDGILVEEGEQGETEKEEGEEEALETE